MKNKDKFSKVFNALLSEKLPEDTVRSLKEEGFKLKSPTRRTALAIALYKKAEKGDLSAIKELCRPFENEEDENSKDTVVIIDDIKEGS